MKTEHKKHLWVTIKRFLYNKFIFYIFFNNKLLKITLAYQITCIL